MTILSPSRRYQTTAWCGPPSGSTSRSPRTGASRKVRASGDRLGASSIVSEVLIASDGSRADGSVEGGLPFGHRSGLRNTGGAMRVGLPPASRGPRPLQRRRAQAPRSTRTAVPGASPATSVAATWATTRSPSGSCTWTLPRDPRKLTASTRAARPVLGRQGYGLGAHERRTPDPSRPIREQRDACPEYLDDTVARHAMQPIGEPDELGHECGCRAHQSAAWRGGQRSRRGTRDTLCSAPRSSTAAGPVGRARRTRAAAGRWNEDRDARRVFGVEEVAGGDGIGGVGLVGDRLAPRLLRAREARPEERDAEVELRRPPDPDGGRLAGSCGPRFPRASARRPRRPAPRPSPGARTRAPPGPACPHRTLPPRGGAHAPRGRCGRRARASGEAAPAGAAGLPPPPGSAPSAAGRPRRRPRRRPRPRRR